MKDSGIKWIGKIPDGWSTIRIKFTSWLKGRIGWDGLKSSEFVEKGPYLITGTDFENGGINWNTCVHISEARYQEDELLHIKENDLLITKDGTIGKLAIVKNCPEKVSLNSGVMIIRGNSQYKYSDKYLYYVLQSDEFFIWFELSQNGNSTIRHLYQGQFYNFEFSYPTIDEQQAIAAFLDKKCFVIDNLISNETKQIEKLKEFKQAIITETMTKGLNKNVPMIDSGIEWIGEIPYNVNVSSVKNFYDITLGKMLQPKQENENDTLEYYFCAANLGNNCLKTNDLKQMWFSVKEKEKYSLKRGDLLVVEGGDVASSSIIVTDVSNIYFQNSIHRVRPIHGLNEYLHYYLIFVKGSGYFDVNCNKATIMHFTKDEFSNLPFLIRNTEEQKKIVTFLNKEETKINRLISIKEKKIEFLTNYKKSLIYEYVTGKKRVSL